MKFKLTLEWPDSPKITVRKEFKNAKEAKKWQANCEAICGKNHLGTQRSKSTLVKL